MNENETRRIPADRLAAVVSIVLLVVMAAALVGLWIWTGYGPLLQLALLQGMGAACYLILLLPVGRGGKTVCAGSNKLLNWLRTAANRFAAWWPGKRSIVLCIAMGLVIAGGNLLFWKQPAQNGSLGYHVPVILVVLFVGSTILEKWCRMAVEQADGYNTALLRSVRSALSLGRIAQLLCFVAVIVKLLGFYDATAILRVVLSLLFAYETVFLAFSLAVRMIRKEMNTAPEFLIPMPGIRGSNMNILRYLEENTGITMRALWSMQLMKKVIPCAVLGVVLVIWLCTGLVQIESYQQGALYRLGKLREEPLEPGIHMTLPWPFDKVEVYDTKSLGKVTIGYESVGDRDNIWTQNHDGEEYRLLLGNGDELISINLEVEYRIDDLYSYISASSAPEALLQAQAYEIVTAWTITSDIESMLSTNRQTFSENFKKELTEKLEPHHTGLTVVNVFLESIHPPVEVAYIYQDLIGATIDAERLIIQAQNLANSNIMAAKDQATDTVGDAYVKKYESIADARGAVAEFMAGVDAYEAYPNSYRFYKYMNMITQAYNGAKLVIVGEGVDAGKLYIGSIGAGQSSQTTDKSENQEGYEHFYDDEYQDELMGEIFGDD